MCLVGDMPPKDVKAPRLLVIHCGALGDFLLSLPALAALGGRWRVHAAGVRSRMALAVEFGVAEAALELDAVDFASVFAAPSERLRLALKGFDAALVWMRDDDRRIQAGLRAAGLEKVWCAPGLPPADWPRHVSEYYLEAARESGFCGLESISLPRLREDSVPESDVMLHPGSGGMDKNWPMEKFAALAGLLEQSGRAVRWLRGPAEERLEYPSGVATLAPETPVGLARLLAGARLYVGNDSGVSHLAGLAGCESVVIFGPTEPALWHPLGPKVRVLRKSGGVWPEVAEVMAEIR
jgi:heptosyltransferase-3